MKDVRPAIRQILLDHPTVAGLIGSSRIYPTNLPQGVQQPSIVYSMVNEDTSYHMQGASNLVSSRYQIDAWATTADLSAELADAAKDALSGFSGDVGYGSNSPQTFVTVQGIFQDQGRDDYDATAKLYVRRRDYFIWFTEFSTPPVLLTLPLVVE